MKIYYSSFFLFIATFILITGCSRSGTQEDLLTSADGTKNTVPVIINTPTPTPIPTPIPTMSPEKLNQNPQPADTVLIHYTGTLENGEQFDSSIGREPLEFVVGTESVIKGFEEGVKSLIIGATKTIRIEPEDAYGEWTEALLIKTPAEPLPPGMGIGAQLQLQNGQIVSIYEITDEHITLDANHKLAGKVLIFELTLVDINP
jgi:peptidylprolyl isomerase